MEKLHCDYKGGKNQWLWISPQDSLLKSSTGSSVSDSHLHFSPPGLQVKQDLITLLSESFLIFFMELIWSIASVMMNHLPLSQLI